MSAPDQDTRLYAAAQLRAVIRSVAVAAFGAVESREPMGGFEVLTRPVLDDPLAGVRAAVLAWRVAFGQMREHAEAARGAGRTWDDIAGALEVPARDEWQSSSGAAAFVWLIEGREPDTGDDPWFRSLPSTRWVCAACGGRVTDRGPFEAHPDDNEAGHRPDCARRAAAVCVYESARGDL